MEKQEGRDHFGYGRDCAVSHGRPLESSEQIESQVKSSSDFLWERKRCQGTPLHRGNHPGTQKSIPREGRARKALERTVEG